MDQAYIQDLVSVYSDFHIYMFISKSEAGTVFAGYVRAGRRIGLFSGRNIIKHRMRRRMARPTKMAV